MKDEEIGYEYSGTEYGKPAVKPKKKKRVLKAFLIIFLVIIVLLLIAVLTFFILGKIGKSKLTTAVIMPEYVEEIDSAVAYDGGKTIVYNGVKYVYNEDVKYGAFLGIDRKYELYEDEAVTQSNAGQSDNNMVIAVDTETGRVSVIMIPRDSMVDIEIFDENGESAGYTNTQLCLAYAFGDGYEKSCLNVINSMERILCGIDIEQYIALDLDGIAPLNDAVGGVEVTSLETFGQYYKFTKGEKVLLMGEMARAYVQSRDLMIQNSDALRRERQKQYINQFVANAFSTVKSDFTKVGDLYGIVDDYSTTNIGIDVVSYYAGVLVGKRNDITLGDEGIKVVGGTAALGEDNYNEYTVDRESALQIVLDVFYTPVDE